MYHLCIHSLPGRRQLLAAIYVTKYRSETVRLYPFDSIQPGLERLVHGIRKLCSCVQYCFEVRSGAITYRVDDADCYEVHRTS
jgi:hypothetical protein